MGSHRGDDTSKTRILNGPGLHSDDHLYSDRGDHHARRVVIVVITVLTVITFVMVIGGRMFASPSADPVKPDEVPITETITETAEVEVTKTIEVPGPVVTHEEPGPTVTQKITITPAPAPTVTKTITTPGPTVTRTITTPGPTVTETVTECPPLIPC